MRIQGFVQEWNSVQADSWVLDTVEKGYRVEFTRPPPQEESFPQYQKNFRITGSTCKKGQCLQHQEEVHSSWHVFLCPLKATQWAANTKISTTQIGHTLLHKSLGWNIWEYFYSCGEHMGHVLRLNETRICISLLCEIIGIC